ncbi:hypothetical protein PG987_008915 [Apiospora arundinis]
MSASRLSTLTAGLLVLGADASYSVHPQQPAPFHNVSTAEQRTATLSTAASHVYTTHETSKGYSVAPVSSQSTLATTLTSYCTNTTISTIIKTSTKPTTSYANVTVPHYTTVPTTKKTTIPVTITETPTCTTTTPPPIITHNSCDQSCSMSAGTVNLFFWPTNNDFTYPPTHVDTALGYTFTSPSVYMLIPTIYGTNTVDGGIVQPTATSAIWAFDLSEVSTIVGGTETKQLSLSDLGTDCPQTAEQSAIATMTDSRCDPILAAPDKIRAWASPCAACERFGLFDPPYAIPTITGAAAPPPAPTTTKAPAPAPTTEAPAPPPTTEAPAPTTAAPAPSITSIITTGPAGVIAVYYENGRAVATSTLAPPPAAPTTTNAGQQPAPSTADTSAAGGVPTTDAGQPAGPSSVTATGGAGGEAPSASITSPAASTSASDGVATPTPVVTAAAIQVSSSGAGLAVAGLLMSLFMMG